MESLLEKIFKTTSYYIIYLIFSIVLMLFSYFTQLKVLLAIASYMLLLALFIQYLMVIMHAKYMYLGEHRSFWIAALLIDPIGPLRIYYIINHFRCYLQNKYRYAYSKYPVMRTLEDLKANVFTGKLDSKGRYEKKPVPIQHSPIYIYLNTNNEEIFTKYHEEIVAAKHKKYKYPLSKFHLLVEKIKNEGYSFSEPFVRVKGNIISDGHHRAAIMAYILGVSSEIPVVVHKDPKASV